MIVQRLRLSICQCGAGLDSKDAKRHASSAGALIKAMRSLADKQDEITDEPIKGFNNELWLKCCQVEGDNEFSCEFKKFL